MKRLYASQAASAALSVPGRRQALGIRTWIHPDRVPHHWAGPARTRARRRPRDYELIAQVTGQPVAWVVPQGDVP
jgi:hypothetical protein